MTRRRRHDVVVFDLDLGDPGAPDDPAGRGRRARGRTPGEPARDDLVGDDPEGVGHDEAATRRPGRTRAQRLREAVVAGTVVVVALAAWGVTNAVHEHERVTRLLDAPGGTLSLAHAPAALWSAGTDSADATAFMPGLVVVRRGTVLHGLDAATGADRWQVEVGGDPVCGLSGWVRGTAAVVDPLVCWSGPNADRSAVTVVLPDGTSSTRDLDEPVDAAAGTADGGLVTVRRIGPTAPAPDVAVTSVDGGGYTVSGSIAQGQDAVVRLEDAVTGTLRWERTVPFRPVDDITTCGSVAVNDGPDGLTADATGVSFATYPALVELLGCGLDAGFTLAGNATTAPGDSAWSWAEPYVDGGVLEQVGVYSGDNEVASVLHGPDGSVVGTYDDQVLQPWATDGTSSDLVLTGSGAVPLKALARDGSLRWQSTHAYGDILVRTAGVILAQRGDLAVSGLDPRTGDALWTDDHLLADDPAAGVRDFVVGAFTDGSAALLVVVHGDQDSTTDLVALDLATGEVRWRSPADSSLPQLVTVQGRLVEIVATMGSVYEDDGNGETVRRSSGTVALLG